MITYNSVISSCEKGGQWNHALGVLAIVRSAYVRASDAWPISSRFLCRHFLCVALRGIDLQALQAITFNSSISACEACGCWKLALRLLNDMSEAILSPTAVTYGAAIGACEKGEQWILRPNFMSFGMT